MPIYDYKCSNCGQEFELIQKFSDKPKTKCPNCEQDTLSKLVSAPSFRLKGGGWYETDFKTGKKRIWYQMIKNQLINLYKMHQLTPRM